MLFSFDIQKTLAAVAFIMKQEGGQVDVFLLLKTLYLADKNALIYWGKTITGDSFVSMNKGPVLSKTYNLIKREGPESLQEVWNAHISERVEHKISLIGEIDIGVLSEREMEVLEAARKQINSIPPWAVARWLHDTCPEWQDPQGSMIPIDPSTILRNAGMSEEEIRQVEESNQTFDYAKYLLTNS